MHYFILILSLSFMGPTSDAKPGLMGGWGTRDPHEAHEAVNQAILMLNNPSTSHFNDEASASWAQMNIAAPLTLIETLSVQTQVVAGINYKLQMKVSAGGVTHEVEVVLWSQPWLAAPDQWKITSISAH